MQIAPDKNHYLENVYMTSQAKFCANYTTAINIFPDANRIPAKFGANCTAQNPYSQNKNHISTKISAPCTTANNIFSRKSRTSKI
jgi:hypothetical protein